MGVDLQFDFSDCQSYSDEVISDCQKECSK